jgi:hypothetical protein
MKKNTAELKNSKIIEIRKKKKNIVRSMEPSRFSFDGGRMLTPSC